MLMKTFLNQDKAVRTVTTSTGDELQVREIVVEDSSGKVNVTLWRDSARSHVKVGQTVIVKVATAAYSHFFKKMALSVNIVDGVEVCL